MDAIWNALTTEEAFVAGGLAAFLVWLIVATRRSPAGRSDPRGHDPHDTNDRSRHETPRDGADPRRPSITPVG